MRTLARWIGGLWLGAAFVAVMVVGFINGAQSDHVAAITPLSGIFGKIHIYIALGIPGGLLLLWSESGKPRSKDVA
jgi:hypothetical protein